MIIHQYDESAVGLEGTWEGREVPELINSDFLMRLIYQYIKRDLGAKKDNKSGAYGISKEGKCFGTSTCSPNTLDSPMWVKMASKKYGLELSTKS